MKESFSYVLTEREPGQYVATVGARRDGEVGPGLEHEVGASARLDAGGYERVEDGRLAAQLYSAGDDLERADAVLQRDQHLKNPCYPNSYYVGIE